MKSAANRRVWIGIALWLAGQILVPEVFAGPLGRTEQSLDTLTLVLELTPEQLKQATELMKAGQAAKFELWGKLMEKFRRLNDTVRMADPKDSDIRALCQEIAALQEQMVLRDALSQVAFRKILDPRQIEKLNRLEQAETGPRHHEGPKRPGPWPPQPREKGR